MQNLIGAALVALARGGLSAGASQSAGRIVPATLCIVAGAILVAAAVGCGIAALWIYAEIHLGAAAAAAISALTLLLMGLALFGAAYLTTRRKPQPSGLDSLAALAPQIMAQVAGTAERLKDEVAKLPKEHGGTLLMAALLAGLAAEQSLRNKR